MDTMQITADKLRAIAEAQGYAVGFNSNMGDMHGYPIINGDTLYSPEDDRAQLDELLEWLGLRGWEIKYMATNEFWRMTKSSRETYHSENKLSSVHIPHKNRTTAILRAACNEAGV